MSITKAWDWEKGFDECWLIPSDECIATSAHWKQDGRKNILDLGCGLGRHAIYFARQGFDVTALDLAEDAITYLNDWCSREKLSITTKIDNMLQLPFPDESFDGIFSYHVISHTDTAGVRKILREVERVLAPNGKLFFTLCSKDSPNWEKFKQYQIDENTILKKEEGPENDVPHFHADDNFLQELSQELELEKVRLIKDLVTNSCPIDRQHYYIWAKKSV